MYEESVANATDAGRDRGEMGDPAEIGARDRYEMADRVEIVARDGG